MHGSFPSGKEKQVQIGLTVSEMWTRNLISSRLLSHVLRFFFMRNEHVQTIYTPAARSVAERLWAQSRKPWGVRTTWSPVECCGARDTAFRSRVIHGREKIQRTLLQSCVYWKWPHSRALKPSSMHRCVLTFSRSPSLHDLCGRLSNGQLLARKRSDLDRTFAKAHGELVEFLWILTPMLDHIDHAFQTFRGSKWLKNAQDLFRISQSEFNTV